MKKTYTITYCEWESYGSMLQAVALQKTIKALGVENKILKDTVVPETKYVAPSLLSKKPKVILKNIYSLIKNKKIASKYKKTLEFMENNIEIQYKNGYDNIVQDPPCADVFIAGSDQIWHPDLCRPFFFLDFVKDGTRRISYAASMGKTRINENKKEELKKLLKNFDAISVREKDNADIVSEFVNKPINVNIDPTFLLPSNEWQKYEKPYPINGKYILVYAIYWDSAFNRKLKELSKKTGMKVISISASLNKVWANKKLFDVSVDEFLWLVHNAEYVVTSSFHGVAFSTIFNKQFSAVINPKLPSRIGALTDLLEIPIVPIEKLSDAEQIIDFENINNKIHIQKEESIKYLKEELFFEK